MDTSIQLIVDNLADGASHRGDCPFCGGNNTLTVSRSAGSIKWNCYKLECKVRGDTTHSLSKAELTTKLVRTVNDTYLYPRWDIPQHFTQPNGDMVKWMDTWGVLDAAYSDRINGLYDPKEDRYCFLAYHQGRPVGCMGRSPDKYAKIKWKHYGETVRMPFIVPREGTYSSPEHHGERVGIIVEDITSAAVVSAYADGVALMGTSLIADYIPVISQYDMVVVCLDKDANHKSIEMTRELSWYTDAHLRISDFDPKNMKSEQLAETFGRRND